MGAIQSSGAGPNRARAGAKREPTQERTSSPPSPDRASADSISDALQPTHGRSPPDAPQLTRLLAAVDADTRAGMLQQLQRSHGNAAVQRIMRAHQQNQSITTRVEPSELRLQREPQAVDVRDLPMADQDQEQIRKTARDKLPVWVDTFANLWFTANNGALGATPEPDDPDFKSEQGMRAKGAFGVSLAGNLIWAAACLVDPAHTRIIAAMSFGGAIVGSGTIGMLAGDSGPGSQPSFRVAAGTALAKGRDRLVAVSTDKVKDVADECALNGISDLEEQKARLWTKMFTTPFNQAEPIQSAAIAKLAKAASSFVAQWQIHKASPGVSEVAWQRVDDRIKRDGYPWSIKLRALVEPSGPGGPADEYRLGLFNEEVIKRAVETFQPELQFG